MKLRAVAVFGVLLTFWVVLTFAVAVAFLVGRASATPPYHPTPLSERLFSDVPTPLGAADPRTVDPAGALRDPGRLLRGASEHRAGAPLPARVAVPTSAPASQNSDAAVRDAAQTPPTAKPSAAISYVTWYDDGPGYYAAAGDWTWGADPYLVVLTRIADGRTYSVTLTVRDACSACRDGSPILDISPMAFRSLGVPLSAGVVRVEVTRP